MKTYECFIIPTFYIIIFINYKLNKLLVFKLVSIINKKL